MPGGGSMWSRLMGQQSPVNQPSAGGAGAPATLTAGPIARGDPFGVGGQMSAQQAAPGQSPSSAAPRSQITAPNVNQGSALVGLGRLLAGSPNPAAASIRSLSDITGV